MNTEERPKLSLRVFKRRNTHLVLLWRKIERADPTKVEITFKCLKGEEPDIKLDPDHFVMNEPAEMTEQMKVANDSVICVVKEELAGIDPALPYYVKVRYGGLDESIKLMPAGVYPAHENEDREKNLHLFLWDDKTSCWRKATGVKGPNGEFGLAVVVVNAQEGKKEK